MIMSMFKLALFFTLDKLYKEIRSTDKSIQRCTRKPHEVLVVRRENKSRQGASLSSNVLVNG